jgi:hypothetical protein
MHTLRVRAPVVVAAIVAIAFGLSVAGSASAHAQRTVDGFAFSVGFINEPVFVGDRSGLEFFVTRDGQAIEGLERTLHAQVTYGTNVRDLPVSARAGVPGAYESAFIPTAAGSYTFRITGTLPDGMLMDESFTSSPTGFPDVGETASGQFPYRLPTVAELATNVQKGADASGEVTIAIGLGAAGLILGLAALGVALAGRRRPT